MFWTSLGHRGRPCLKREEDRKEGGLRSCYIPELPEENGDNMSHGSESRDRQDSRENYSHLSVLRTSANNTVTNPIPLAVTNVHSWLSSRGRSSTSLPTLSVHPSSQTMDPSPAPWHES
jgi:hypothetical protein